MTGRGHVRLRGSGAAPVPKGPAWKAGAQVPAPRRALAAPGRRLLHSAAHTWGRVRAQSSPDAAAPWHTPARNHYYARRLELRRLWDEVDLGPAEGVCWAGPVGTRASVLVMGHSCWRCWRQAWSRHRPAASAPRREATRPGKTHLLQTGLLTSCGGRHWPPPETTEFGLYQDPSHNPPSSFARRLESREALVRGSCTRAPPGLWWLRHKHPRSAGETT